MRRRFFSQVRGLPNVNVGLEALGFPQFSFKNLEKGGGKGGDAMQVGFPPAPLVVFELMLRQLEKNSTPQRWFRHPPHPPGGKGARGARHGLGARAGARAR